MDVTVRCPHCRGLVHIKGERTQEGVQYHGVVKERATHSELYRNYLDERNEGATLVLSPDDI